MEWHIWDFPDNIMVYFTEEFRIRLYNKLKEICKTNYEIAKMLETNKETVRRSLHLGHRNGVKAYAYVRIIKKIVEIFGKQLGTDFLNQLERNIVAYRTWNGWNVKNPILPIKETPELYSIVFHLIGDGNASTRHSPFYSNKCRELVDNFIQTLQIFGNVETKSKFRNNTGVTVVYFPKAVVDILSHIMEIRFTHPDSLPKRIFDAPLECKIAAIRAFVDDEGCISANGASSVNFYISQKSKNILLQLKQIMNSIGIKSGKVSINKRSSVHRLHISNASCEKYLKIIGFSHKGKKNKLIWLLRKNKLIKRTWGKINNVN